MTTTTTTTTVTATRKRPNTSSASSVEHGDDVDGAQCFSRLVRAERSGAHFVVVPVTIDGFYRSYMILVIDITCTVTVIVAIDWHNRASRTALASTVVVRWRVYVVAVDASVRRARIANAALCAR